MTAQDGHGRGRGTARRLLRTTLWTLAAVAVLLASTLAAGVILVRSSLPLATGTHPVPGLERPVAIERDALGVPRVRASSREDLATATGFLHAQERAFQMDLLRRRAAGELEGLLGAAALTADLEMRRHGLRERAERAARNASPRERVLLEAYAAGVNAGWDALGARPPEYLLLRTSFEPWRPADSILTVHAMYVLLQDPDGERERRLGLMHDTMDPGWLALLLADGTPWDAPLAGAPRPAPAVPLLAPAAAARHAGPPDFDGVHPQRAAAGSNAFAVGGARTRHGGAIVASDMHLPLGLPNTWYRATLEWDDGGTPRRVSGVTLPGTPAVVVGSNGRIAWGFTNSYGDWTDVFVARRAEDDPGRYLVPGGSEAFEIRDGTEWTRWGPVVATATDGRAFVSRWVGHAPGAVNLGLAALETAGSVAEALDAAATAGIPAQNLVVGDRDGTVGWTIMGPIPRRSGCDGAGLPMRGATSGCAWDGWLSPEEYPRLVDPHGGVVWTANNRVVDGAWLAVLGDGGYDLGARAQQIRDALFALGEADEASLLAVQLDDRARLLDAWQARLVATADGEWTGGDARREEFARLVGSWGRHASTSSAGYRFVRAFRGRVIALLFEGPFAPCRAVSPGCGPGGLPQIEGAAAALLDARPPEALPDDVVSYEALLARAATEVFDHFAADGRPLAARTWGERNTVGLVHPLARAVPLLRPVFALEPRRLPGDTIVPRVQSPSFGASERMVVAPGREEQGILHMPGGQSGHPLSPHFGDQAVAWAEGRITPLLPGEPVSTLVLEPAGE